MPANPLLAESPVEATESVEPSTSSKNVTAIKQTKKRAPAKKTVAKKAATAKKPEPVEAKPSQPSAKSTKRQGKKKLSRNEQIANQANPKSILVGRQKTLTLRLDYCSDILHEYLQLNQSTMLAAYERLAGLLRLVATDKSIYTHVNDWIKTNLSICQEQVNAMQAQRESLSEDCADEVDSLQISIPDNYHTEFQASHPICHKMLAVLKLVDAELNASEDLFMAGIIDDASYMSLRTQATSIVRGSVDRIYKATSPGTREGGRYAPAQLAAWIRSGNQMLFADVPKDLEHLIDSKA